LRYGRDKLTGSTAQFLRLASGPVITSVPVTPQAATFNATTGNVNVNYKITPDVLVYASYSRGDSPGGFNSGLAALEPFGPQNVDAYELGMKSMWLDHRLQLNMALFNNEYSNLQLSQNRNINGVAAQLVVNAAQARGRGFDMDGAAVLSSNWRLNWNYTYSESRITHYDVPPPTRLGLPIDLTGIPLVRSPKNSGNISITYNTDALGPGRLELTAAQSYTSSYINDYTGVPAGTAYPGRTGVPAGEPPLAPGVTTTQVLGLYSTKGYGLTSLNASYIVGRWEVSAYVRNLFNKQYIATLAALDTFTYPNEVPGEPRTWEIRLKYNF
jgi:outer membrane receptor protein involved in Fe transport